MIGLRIRIKGLHRASRLAVGSQRQVIERRAALIGVHDLHRVRLGEALIRRSHDDVHRLSLALGHVHAQRQRAAFLHAQHRSLGLRRGIQRHRTGVRRIVGQYQQIRIAVGIEARTQRPGAGAQRF